MTARVFVLLALATVGCHDAVRPAASPPPRIEDIDFADWPTATPEPHLVPHKHWGMCRSFNESGEKGVRLADEERKKLFGPHATAAIVVRTNPAAMEAFRDRQSPMPVGTVVVKEKHADPAAAAPVAEYGAMVKREAGYDPANGDWEYVDATRGAGAKVTRGRLASCAACHAQAKDRDFLFRNYLPGGGPVYPGW